jgi:DNA mismatch repair protein MutL
MPASTTPTHRPIARLSPALVNRIAAGEVIERPASVVKELIENAIDAGATHITIEIADGGRSLIRVTDNGCGIPEAEMGLAFAAHATSKLATDADLFAIDTLGFRGEALASIGAVSHARILSRTADSQAAYEIIDDGGECSDIQAAAGNIGTTVQVRDLFFNVPARRKFLKGTATEFGHVADVVQRTALSQPAVHFELIHGDRRVAEYPVASDQQRWLAAWPAEFRDQHLPIDARDAELRLRGIIGRPDLARPQPKYQFLYLNGRPIRDKFIQHALREAYRGLTEPGRHPAAVLLLDIPAADVDVNVHPTKSEVRFKDSGRIHGLVMAAVRERLLGSDLSARAVPRGEEGMRFASGNLSAAPDADRLDMRARLAEFFKSGAAPAAPHAAPSLTGASTPASHFAPSPSTETEGWSEGYLARAESKEPSPSPSVSHRIDQPSSLPPSKDAASAAPVPTPLRPAIQLHNTYVVAESEDGLVIIDQHALHERIIFEELLARVTRGPLESQRLLVPRTFAASARQLAMLEQLAPILPRLGIEAAPFGPEAIAVQAFPTFLERLEPEELLGDLLDRPEADAMQVQQEQLLHEVLDMMACKAAIKAGDPLSEPEIAALLARRELVDRASNCPHGRPTTLRLSLHDLEKQFKRTGF